MTTNLKKMPEIMANDLLFRTLALVNLGIIHREVRSEKIYEYTQYLSSYGLTWKWLVQVCENPENHIGTLNGTRLNLLKPQLDHVALLIREEVFG